MNKNADNISEYCRNKAGEKRNEGCRSRAPGVPATGVTPRLNAVLLIAVGTCCIRVACVPNCGGFSSAAADISTQRGTEKARI